MNIYLHFLKFILISELYFSLIYLANSLTYESFNGYHVKELTSLTSQRFDLEAQPWNTGGQTSSYKKTFCGPTPILGGFGIFGTYGYFEGNFTFLPSHNMIYIKIGFFILDEWRPPDKLKIQLDGLNIPASGVIFDRSQFPSNICGSIHNDLGEFTLISKYFHINNNLTINISYQSHGNHQISNPSFGIRNISLIFANTLNPIQYDGCFHVSDSNAIQGGGVTGCSCPIGTYPDPLDPTQCLNCDQSCSDCFGLSAGECYDCKPGYSFVDTECIKCHSSCDTCSGPNEDQCVTCSNSLWLHWNNTCLSTCDSSATAQEEIDDFKVCHTPCFSSEFMLWNQTCASSCAFPLIQKIVRNDNLCQKPCDEGKFLYPNSSCLSSCVSPFIIKNLGNVRLCEYPCNFAENEFLFSNSSCIAECPLPYTQRIENQFRFCVDNKNTILSQEERELASQMSKLISITGNIASAGVITKSILSSTSSSYFSIASLAKMLYYIRYMKINYPPKLEYLLLDQNSSSISFNFGPELPQAIQDIFPTYPLPEKFGYYNLDSSFIVNFGDALSTLIIILSIAILSSLISTIIRNPNQKYIRLVFLQIKNVTKWGLFLIVFCTNFDGIVFYSSLELKTIGYFDLWSSYFSLLSCFVVNSLAIFVLYKILKAVLDYRKRKFKFVTSSPEQDSNFINNKSTTFELFIRNFKDGSFFQQSFLLFFLIRLYLFDLIIGYLFEYPLVQAILIATMSTLMIIYLLFQRPFKETLDLIEYIINEGILFIVNINVLILAILDFEEVEAHEDRASCGEIIIICNVAFNILALIFMSFEAVSGLIKAYKIIKTSKGKINWINIFLLIFEKDGMTLESEKFNHAKILASPNQSQSRAQAKSNLLQTQKNNSSSASHFSQHSPTMPLKNKIIINDGDEKQNQETLTDISPKISLRSTFREFIKETNKKGSQSQNILIKREASDIVDLNIKTNKMESEKIFRSSNIDNSNSVEPLKFVETSFSKKEFNHPRRNLQRGINIQGIRSLNFNLLYGSTTIPSHSSNNVEISSLNRYPLSTQLKINETDAEKYV